MSSEANNCNNGRITVGAFYYEAGSIFGPAEYMREQGNAKLDGILAGTDAAFNVSAHQSPNVETAVLVSMQTDYAGWLGMRQLLAALGSKRPTGADAGR